MPKSRVAITAWSVCNVLAQTTAGFRAALQAGRCGLTVAPRLPDSERELGFSAPLGALGNWPLQSGVPLERDTRQLRLARAASSELSLALAQAIEHWGAARVGLVLGTSTGGLRSSELAYPVLREGAPTPEWYSCRDGHAFDAAPRQLALEWGIEGPLAVVSTACSSAGKAIATARRLLDHGVCDAVLTGGVDTLCALTVMGFRSLGVLASEPSKPFAAEATGMTVAEGAAWLLLERGTGGLQLLGTGESSDAHHLVTPDPQGLGTTRAIERALADAGLSPADVDYVNAHGTGTHANDVPEAAVLRRLFPSCPIQSTKANHGHQLGASAATEAVVCLEVLGGLSPKSDLAPSKPEQSASSEPPRIALSNTLGFGGSNVCLLFERTDSPLERLPTPAVDLQVEIDRVSVWAPDLEPEGILGLTQHRAREPGALLLPARERGRAALLTRMFAECLAALGSKEELARLPMVYASAFGPVSTTLELLDQQLGGECSPLRFQASVHNAAAGILSTALGNTHFATATAAGEQSTAFALLEALCWLHSHPEDEAVLVLVGDELPPQPLLHERYAPLAVGFKLRRSTQGSTPALGVCRWSPARESRSFEAPSLSQPRFATSPASDAALQDALANPSANALRAVLALSSTEPSAFRLPLGYPAAEAGHVEVCAAALQRF